MRGIGLLVIIVTLIAVAGFMVRPSNKIASNTLYIISAILGLLLILGLTRLA
ncbi:MAG: hypothetical protein GY807_11815 [Gammaproteobacteria bacterium]|nr:hypothetical protein [Gammaproteobacteria bacterium]